MVTEDEKNEIVALAIEKCMLMLPEVVGNLITHHVTLTKLNTEFYSKHPEFKDKKDVVASVVEMLDGKNPNMDYAELLELAVPVIKERIGIVSKLSINDAPEPRRDFNGVI